MILELSTRTAAVARSRVHPAPTLPQATLGPSRSASALASLQQREHSLIDATWSTLSAHLTSIATFAQRVVDEDTLLSRRFGS